MQEIKHTSRSGSKLNMFQYSSNNSKQHEHTKFLIFAMLRDKGYDVLVEPEFKDFRPDLVCFDNNGNGFIFEIVNSETEESIEKKKKKYSPNFDLYFFRTGEDINLPI
jgi:hypothetical protein